MSEFSEPDPPNVPKTFCDACKSDVSEAVANGATACPVCGWWLKLSNPSGGKISWRSPRTRLWLLFACFIVGTPVNVYIGALIPGQDFLGPAMFYLGTLGGGFTLAKIYAKKRWSFWVLGIVFSLCIMALLALAFILLLGSALGHNC